MAQGFFDYRVSSGYITHKLKIIIIINNIFSHIHVGLHTRAVLDAIAESSLTGSWCQVNFITDNGSDKSRMGSEERMVQFSSEQKKEKADEKEYSLPVLRKMLTH